MTAERCRLIVLLVGSCLAVCTPAMPQSPLVGDTEPGSQSIQASANAIQRAHAARDLDSVVAQLATVDSLLGDRPDIESALVALPAVGMAMRVEDTVIEALPVAEKLTLALQEHAIDSGDWRPVATLLKLAGRARFELAESDVATQHLRQLLNLYRSISLLDRNTDVRFRWSPRLGEIANEYLRGQQLNSALEILGLAADLQLPLRLDDVSDGLADRESLVRYFRPLEDGDTLTYEFLHEPGRVEIHPALGRLAFLIETSGVRIHWITAGDCLSLSASIGRRR